MDEYSNLFLMSTTLSPKNMVSITPSIANYINIITLNIIKILLLLTTSFT